MNNIVGLFLLLAFVSFGAAADGIRQNQEDDIREAVFRWQFDHSGGWLQQETKAYYLQVGENDNDPSDELIKRFSGHKPPVRKGSACNANIRTGVLDKQTGERGLILRVRSIEWQSDSEVKVLGGYYEGGRSASGNTYTLKNKNGKWEVTNDKERWVS